MCTCRAGQFGNPCYYQAAVSLYRLARQAAGGPVAVPITATVAVPSAPSVRPSDAAIRAAILEESRSRTRTVDELEDLPTLMECFTTVAA